MSEKFLEFRKRARLNRLLTAVVFGLIAAIFATGLTLLLQKLLADEIEILLPIAIGAGALLLTTALVFLIALPTEQKIASEIDDRYLGRERVQTMLAFGGEESDMLSLQREDTEQKLSQLPPPKIGLSTLIVMIVTALLSVALLVTALLLPAKAEEPPTPPPPQEETAFAFSEWQQARLRALITYVEDSQLEASAKQTAVDELNALYNDLLSATTRAQMLTLVTDSMVVIDDKIETINTFEEIIGALAKSTDPSIVELAKAIGKVTATPNVEELNNLKSNYRNKEAGFFTTLVAKLNLDLVKLESYREDDIYLAIAAMTSDFEELETALSSVSDAEARGLLIDATLDAIFTEISLATADQTINRTVGDTIISELMFIFDITKTELPASILDNGVNYENSSGNYEEEEDETLTDGGAGRDEMNYGSNDEIYDPDEARRVQYGEVYNKYSAIMREKLINGELPPEYEKFITDYFSALYSGDVT